MFMMSDRVTGPSVRRRYSCSVQHEGERAGGREGGREMEEGGEK